MQKFILFHALLSIALAAGCAAKPTGTKPPRQAGRVKQPTEAAAPAKLLIEPDTLFVGRVIKVNAKEQFVLISFPIGWLPRPGQPLYVYRNGQQIGELKATYHMLDDLVIADIVNGICQPGDEVSDK